MVKNKDFDSRDKKPSIASRGTQDEVEILAIIIEENPMLKRRVLDAIRFARAGKVFGQQVPVQEESPPADKKGKKKPA